MNMHKETFSVGVLASHAGCNIETVRYYENEKLMPAPPRTEGGHRQYSEDHLKRLYFIRRCRELGFPIDQVREMLKIIDEPNHTCGEVKGLTMLQMRQVQEKIDDLTRLMKALSDIFSQCDGGGYTIDNCPIIQALYRDTG
ncbi:MAG: MerR family transcriptional regulator [marine bacterium B5-7]|nr:MAG: MerR family transcriptional regulator [marine bacterium B5-7]